VNASPLAYRAPIRALAGYGPILAILLVGIIASLVVFDLSRAVDRARSMSVLELRAEWRARDLQAKIYGTADAASALAAFIASQGEPDRSSFHRFARSTYQEGDPIRSLVWAPRVLREQRAAFEAAAQARGIAGFQIREPDARGELVPAAPRDDYFPVYLQEPFEGQATLLGLDLLSLPERRTAAMTAIDSARPIAAPPVTTEIKNGISAPRYLVFWPVYDGDRVPDSVPARRAMLRGLAVGVFRVEAMLDAAIRDTPEIVEAIDVFTEGTAGNAKKAIATFVPRLRRFTAPQDDAAGAGEVTITRSFDVLGRHWRLVSRFPSDVVTALRSTAPQTSLLAGLLLTAFIVLYFHRERRRRTAVEKLVAERTADLEMVNEALRTEAAERQKAEAQLIHAQKMEAIGNLTGGLAHDFNNLLGVIIGNLDLLNEGHAGDAEAQELTRDALEAALRGAELTRGLLAFARRQPLQPQRIDVNEHVAAITKLLKRVLGEQIEMIVDLEPGVWPAFADPVQLEAALANLATNARDAMPGGGRLRIATTNRQLDQDYASEHPEVTPGDYAMVEVSDTGTGIAPEVIGRIFEPFFTTKERGEGSGLGLSMVFGYMKQSGGHVNVYSEIGVGTTFRLYLPRARLDHEREERPAGAAAARGAGEMVLVVEDNLALRRVVVRQLAELGYIVQEAEAADKALEILETGPEIDLLLTDVVMPGAMDGIELARTVLARWPRIKVLLTSGFPGTKINGESGISGEIRLLSKPYRKEDLARTLRDILDGEKGEQHGSDPDHR